MRKILSFLEHLAEEGDALAKFSAHEQVLLLPGLPRDRGAADFYTAFERNPLWLAADALTTLTGWVDWLPYEEWRESVVFRTVGKSRLCPS